MGAATTQQQHDNRTGLYYYGARFYDPQIGRFLSADTWAGDNKSPPSLHRYLYAYSNPMKYTDPTGHAPEAVNTAWGYTAPSDSACGKTKTCSGNTEDPTQPGTSAPQATLASYFTQESQSGRAVDVGSLVPNASPPPPADQATKDRVGVGAGDPAPTDRHSLRSKDGLGLAFLKSLWHGDFSPGSPFANEVAFGDHPILQSDKALTKIQNGVIAATVGAEAAILTGGIAAAWGAGAVATSSAAFVGGGAFTRGTGVGLEGGSATDQLKAMVDPAGVAQDAILGAGLGAATVLMATVVVPSTVRALGSLRSAVSGASSEAAAAERAVAQSVAEEGAVVAEGGALGARINTGKGLLPNGEPVALNNCPFCTAANASSPKLTSSLASKIAGIPEQPLTIGRTGSLFRRLGLGNGVPEGPYASTGELIEAMNATGGRRFGAFFMPPAGSNRIGHIVNAQRTPFGTYFFDAQRSGLGRFIPRRQIPGQQVGDNFAFFNLD